MNTRLEPYRRQILCFLFALLATILVLLGEGSLGIATISTFVSSCILIIILFMLENLDQKVHITVAIMVILIFISMVIGERPNSTNVPIIQGFDIGFLVYVLSFLATYAKSPKTSGK